MDTLGIFIMFGIPAIWFMVWAVRSMPTVSEHRNYMATMRAEQKVRRDAWLVDAPASVQKTAEYARNMMNRLR